MKAVGSGGRRGAGGGRRCWAGCGEMMAAKREGTGGALRGLGDGRK